MKLLIHAVNIQTSGSRCNLRKLYEVLTTSYEVMMCGSEPDVTNQMLLHMTGYAGSRDYVGNL